MKTLPYDVARCSGRYSFKPDTKWCPERGTCQRYLAFTQWDKAAGIPDYRDMPVCMANPGCVSKIEVVEVEV